MQDTISFDVTDDDEDLIHQIVRRAMDPTGHDYSSMIDPLTLEMDLTACHANGCPLRLQELLDADNFNFAHDVLGINRHMNRDTGQLEDCFLPRFAAPPIAG
jgi:hypothetical protein